MRKQTRIKWWKKKATATINPPGGIPTKCVLITLVIRGAFMGPERSGRGAEAAGLRGRFQFLPRYRDPCAQHSTRTQDRLWRQQRAAFHIHVQTGPFNLFIYLSTSTWFVRCLFIYLLTRPSSHGSSCPSPCTLPIASPWIQREKNISHQEMDHILNRPP